jgi:hypothetical protein
MRAVGNRWQIAKFCSFRGASTRRLRTSSRGRGAITAQIGVRPASDPTVGEEIGVRRASDPHRRRGDWGQT